MDETYNPAHEQLTQVLEEAGLVRQFDVDIITGACTADTLARVPVWAGHRDRWGEDFARTIYAAAFDEHTLPVVFVGDAHIPVIAEEGDSHGFFPMITGAYLPKNIAAKLARYHTLEDPIVLTTTIQADQNGFGSTLGAIEHYGFQNKQWQGTRPFVYVGDSHFQRYDLDLPSVDQLHSAGIDSVTTFVEGLPQGGSSLDAMHEGLVDGRPLVGMQLLAGRLEEYQRAGIAINVYGLEPPGGRYGAKPRSLYTTLAEHRRQRTPLPSGLFNLHHDGGHGTDAGGVTPPDGNSDPEKHE